MKYFLIAIFGVLFSSHTFGMEVSSQSPTTSQRKLPGRLTTVRHLVSRKKPVYNGYQINGGLHLHGNDRVWYKFSTINSTCKSTEPEDRILFWYNGLKTFANKTDEKVLGEAPAFAEVLHKKFGSFSDAQAEFSSLHEQMEKRIAYYNACDITGWLRTPKAWWRSLAKREFFAGLGFMGIGSLLHKLVIKEDAFLQKIFIPACSAIGIAGIYISTKANNKHYRTARDIKKHADTLLDSATKNYTTTSATLHAENQPFAKKKVARKKVSRRKHTPAQSEQARSAQNVDSKISTESIDID